MQAQGRVCNTEGIIAANNMLFDYELILMKRLRCTEIAYKHVHLNYIPFFFHLELTVAWKKRNTPKMLFIVLNFCVRSKENCVQGSGSSSDLLSHQELIW